MNQENIIYLGLTALIALSLISQSAIYGPFRIVVIALAIVALIIILIINYADFLVFPIFTRIFRISVIPARNYIVPKEQEAVIKNVNNLFYATGYLTANIYNYVFQAEAVEGNVEKAMANSPEAWEKAIMAITFPFKFNMITSAEEVQNYRDELEGERGYFEYQISREMTNTNPNQINVQELQRKVNIVQARIDRISTGEKPVKTIMYLESTAVGVSEKDAKDALTNQLNQLQTIFNVFDLSVVRVSGRELHFLFKFNYMLYGMADLEKLFEMQR